MKTSEDNLRNLWDNFRQTMIYILGFQNEKKVVEILFSETMAEKFQRRKETSRSRKPKQF